jgi:release factor glutamine methyltransferase
MVFMAADLLPYHVDPPYTVVCANLPYVPTGEIPALAPELSFEPSLALDGGPDGLDVVRRLLDSLPRTLAPDGVAFLEIGADHGDLIAREVAARLPGWRCRVTNDLAGYPRLARVEPGDPGQPGHGAAPAARTP